MTDNVVGLIVLTGVGATALTDFWCLVRERVFAVPFPNYGFVGRWIAHMARRSPTWPFYGSHTV